MLTMLLKKILSKWKLYKALKTRHWGKSNKHKRLRKFISQFKINAKKFKFKVGSYQRVLAIQDQLVRHGV